MRSERNCNFCAKTGICPKSHHIENYRLSGGCMDFVPFEKPNNSCGECPVYLAGAEGGAECDACIVNTKGE